MPDKEKESAFALIPQIRSKGISVHIPNTKLAPFEFFKQYLAALQKAQEDLYEHENAKWTGWAIQYLMEAHVIEVDSRLIPLIERTKNEVFYRPLFFKKIFVDAEFHVGDYVIRGIMIVDKDNDWFLETAVRYVPTDNGTLVVSGLLNDPKIDYGHPDLNKEIQAIIKHVRTMACNFVDLVEATDEDVEITTITPTKEQQAKREMRKKPRLQTKVYIHPKTHFIKYLETLNKGIRSPIKGAFEVAGHWRHYERSTSPRFSAKTKSKPKWIKDFQKGEGILKIKKRKLTKGG